MSDAPENTSFEDNEPVEVEAEVLRENDASIYVETEAGCFWVLKSLVQPESEISKPGEQGKLVLPHWVAEIRGLA